MIPTEAQEAEALVAYLRLKGYKFTHIPNETGSSLEARRRAVRMKRQGVSRGFPDYIILTEDNVIYLELKRTKGSRTSPEQTEWCNALEKAGQTVFVAKGCDEAIKFIESVDNS